MKTWSKRASLEESIELAVPARVAYNQWTQFTTFPELLPALQKVEQIDDGHLRWSARIGGRTHEWVAEICEQIPDKRIAWRTLSGPRNAGVVTFHRLDDGHSKVMLQMDYEPRGVTGGLCELIGLDRLQVGGFLTNFKTSLEERGKETGAWRGTIRQAAEAKASAKTG